MYNLFSECNSDQDWHEGLCPRDPAAMASALAGSIAVALVVKGILTIVVCFYPALFFPSVLMTSTCFRPSVSNCLLEFSFRPSVRLFNPR